VNPKAGKCEGIKRLQEVLRVFQHAQYLSTVLLTEKSGDAAEFAMQYGNEHDMIVGIGGDGTFSEIVSGMVSGKIDKPIGYIPAGSANDYGSSIGLSNDVYTAACDIVNGRSQWFDIGLFNERPFVYVAAFGSFAKVSYQTPQDLKNLFGHAAYILEGVREFPLRSEHVAMEIDGEKIEGDYILGFISNTLSIGKIIRFSPREVLMNDGYLEIVLVSMPSNPKDLSEIIQALSTQSYSGCRNIVFRRGKKIRIQASDEMSWSLDGEYAQSKEESVVSIVPNAIRVMVPLVDE